MNIVVRGSTQVPVITLIGTFDPLTQDHLDLMQVLVARCMGEELAAGVTLLTPSPWRLMSKELPELPEQDIEDVIAKMREVGIHVVATAHLLEADLQKDAFSFLNHLRRAIPLAGLWLGATQTLGSGPLGSSRAVADFAAAAGMEFKIVRHDVGQKQRTLAARQVVSQGSQPHMRV